MDKNKVKFVKTNTYFIKKFQDNNMKLENAIRLSN